MTKKRKICLIAAPIAISTVAIGALAAWEPLMLAGMGTAYSAKVVCSCLHAAGRPLASCLGDLPAKALERVSVSANGDRVVVTALGGLISAHAVYEPGYGCTIMP